MSLTFDKLRQADRERAAAFVDTDWDCSDWSVADWAVALAGEVGEACNLIKKRRRGSAIANDDIARELADVQIYLDLLANKLGIDLGLWTVRKFNEVSIRQKVNVFIKE